MNSSTSSSRSFNQGISELELKIHCETHTKTCHDKIESKIKVAVLDLRLWIVTSIVVFLLGFGGSVMCGIKQVGNIEERIANQGDAIKKLDAQIEMLRKEVWEAAHIGPYTDRSTTTVGDNNDTKNNDLLPVASTRTTGTGITSTN